MKRYNKITERVSYIYHDEGITKPVYYIKKSHYIHHHLDLYENYWKNQHKPQNLLDVGTGQGRFAVTFKTIYPSLEVYAFDDNKDTPEGDYRLRVKMLTKLLDNYQQFNLNDGFPYKDNYFDTIIMADVLEHLWKPRKCLLEIKRCLKNEGLLILSTPNIASFRKRIKFLFGVNPASGFLNSFWNDVPFRGHIREYTMNELKQCIKQIGFEIMESRYIQYDFFKKIKVLNYLKRMPELIIPQFRNALIFSARKK